MKLNEQILNMIRSRVASPLARPSDFEALAADIEARTGEHPGVNTLKRLFGFIDNNVNATRTTLDIVARYLGYASFELLEKCIDDKNSEFAKLTDVVYPQSLAEGTIIEVTYQPLRLVRMKVEADHRCRIVRQENTKLADGDLLDIGQIVVGIPLYVREVVRKGESLSSYVGGREGGVISIKIEKVMKEYWKEIIDKYYPEDNELKRLLVRHSNDVRDLALEIVDSHPEMNANRQLVIDGAMLHDIGIFKTDAPSIHCHGSDPYICHGIDGAAIMRKEGREDIARICERHTGTGITPEQIEAQGLPIPMGDYQPETIEEKIVCYADKFYSKSHPERKKTLGKAAHSLEKFGSEGVEIFLMWAKLFE